MKYLGLIILMFLTSQIYADTWYNDVGTQVTRVEQESNGTIWIMAPLSDLSPKSNAGCSFTQIKILPPSGRQDSWFSLVLAALLSKKSLNVYGTCGANTTITTSRITVDTE